MKSLSQRVFYRRYNSKQEPYIATVFPWLVSTDTINFNCCRLRNLFKGGNYIQGWKLVMCVLVHMRAK